MSTTPNSTLFDTLTPAQGEVLKALVEGATITAAAQQGGVHRSTVHLWTRNHPAFACTLLAARQNRAETLLDELADLSKLACDTFRQLLSDPATPAATRLKAAMEIVKLVQNQRPAEAAQHKLEQFMDRQLDDIHLAKVATNPTPCDTLPPNMSEIRAKEPVRNAPCPCGSRLKYKRCCGNPVTATHAA